MAKRRGPIPKKKVITTQILQHRSDAESLLEPKDEQSGRWAPEVVVAAITYRATDMPYWKIAQELSRLYGADVPQGTISKWWHSKGKDNVALQQIINEQKQQWVQKAFAKVYDLLDMIDLEKLDGEKESVLTIAKILGILVDKIGVLLPKQTFSRGVSGVVESGSEEISDGQLDEEINKKMKQLGQVTVTEKRVTQS